MGLGHFEPVLAHHSHLRAQTAALWPHYPQLQAHQSTCMHAADAHACMRKYDAGGIMSLVALSMRGAWGGGEGGPLHPWSP
jgi:hypothetical protein